MGSFKSFFLRFLGFPVKDQMSEAETRALARARSYKDDRPIETRAKEYEDYLFANFGPGDLLPWLTNRRKVKGDKLYKGTVADAGINGGRGLLAAQVYKHAAGHGDLWRISQAFKVIDALCRISGEPGLVVRGVVPIQEVEESGWRDMDIDGDNENKWFRGKGEFAGYYARSDPSPGQFKGVVYGLQCLYDLGPKEYRERAKNLLRDIGRYLIRNKFQIIDYDGEPTQVSDFGLGLIEVAEVPDGTGGGLGIFIRTADPGIATINRNSRALTLLGIMRACASVTQDKAILDAYMALCGAGYAAMVKDAGFNFQESFADAGMELQKLDAFSMLAPFPWRGPVPDESFQPYFSAGAVRIWDWFHDLGHLPGAIHLSMAARLAGWAVSDDLVLAYPKDAIKAVEMLESWPHPKFKLPVVNSKRDDIQVDPLPGLTGLTDIEALSIPADVLPRYEAKRSSWLWESDLRRLDWGDVEKDWEPKEIYSPADFLFAYWLCEWSKTR